MPALIDRHHRQEELAEATWRIILRDGVSAVSVRTVAAEAGLSTGSLRHVFPSKTDLLAFSMQLVNVRAEARVRAHLSEPDPFTLAVQVLAELLPIDAERLAEMRVNIALIAEAPGHPRLKELQDESYRAIRWVCEQMISQLQKAELTRQPLNLSYETAALHAFIDGLAVHIVIEADPEFAGRATELLSRYLRGLLA
ncbi:MAG TPA: TetR family transcriptional regulator C-terminal domain-containing protein [Glaciihabitans sp.]|jgi:AcrR family transcriptional regulator|nr:TetR family transcriptional regulator C-terminal domain-containing protein [Glaciihabitans sp.]